MIIGITGTRHKPTTRQSRWLFRILRDGLDGTDIAELHHGACTGADAVAHEQALHFGLRVIVHPPVNEKWLDWDAVHPAPGANVVVLEPKPYHERNADIVTASAGLIVIPNSYEPYPHSDTWSTYYKAVAAHKPTWICRPDGTVVYESNADG